MGSGRAVCDARHVARSQVSWQGAPLPLLSAAFAAVRGVCEANPYVNLQHPSPHSSDAHATRNAPWHPGKQQQQGARGSGGAAAPAAKAPPKAKAPPPPPRRNEEIRAKEVRAILPDGSHRVLPTAEALALARSMGLDLIQVPGASQPPVAKVADFAALMAAQRRAADEAARAQRLREKLETPKEVQFTARIAGARAGEGGAGKGRERERGQ